MAKRARHPKKSTRKSSRRARQSPVPKRLRAKRPRGRDGKFLTRAAAKRQRAYYERPKPRRPKPFRLKRERDIRRKKGKRPAQAAPVALPLRDFLISMSYRGRKGRRTIDFVAAARTKEDALKQLYEDKPWAKRIPWQKVSIHEGPETTSHELQPRLEMKASSNRKRAKRKST